MSTTPHPMALPGRVCILTLHTATPMTPYQQAALAAQSALNEVEAARQVLRDKQHKYFRLSERASSLFEAEHQVFLANLPNLGQAVKQRIDQRRAEISGTR